MLKTLLAKKQEIEAKQERGRVAQRTASIKDRLGQIVAIKERQRKVIANLQTIYGIDPLDTVVEAGYYLEGCDRPVELETYNGSLPKLVFSNATYIQISKAVWLKHTDLGLRQDLARLPFRVWYKCPETKQVMNGDLIDLKFNDRWEDCFLKLMAEVETLTSRFKNREAIAARRQEIKEQCQNRQKVLTEVANSLNQDLKALIEKALQDYQTPVNLESVTFPFTLYQWRWQSGCVAEEGEPYVEYSTVWSLSDQLNEQGFIEGISRTIKPSSSCEIEKKTITSFEQIPHNFIDGYSRNTTFKEFLLDHPKVFNSETLEVSFGEVIPYQKIILTNSKTSCSIYLISDQPLVEITAKYNQILESEGLEDRVNFNIKELCKVDYCKSIKTNLVSALANK